MPDTRTENTLSAWNHNRKHAHCRKSEQKTRSMPETITENKLSAWHQNRKHAQCLKSKQKTRSVPETRPENTFSALHQNIKHAQCQNPEQKTRTMSESWTCNTLNAKNQCMHPFPSIYVSRSNENLKKKIVTANLVQIMSVQSCHILTHCHIYHTQHIFVTHADDLLCLQLHTGGSRRFRHYWGLRPILAFLWLILHRWQ